MWADYGYVVSSKYRVAVILSLSTHPKTPKQVSDETRLGLTHVSRALKELQERSIAVCINPNNVKGRVYLLTDKGRQIALTLKEDREKAG